MKIKGLHFCSFDPFEDNIKFRQHNNEFISFGVITYDTITKDTASVIQQAAGSSLSLTMTIGNNPNRILIIGVGTLNNSAGSPPSVSSVKIGSTNFTHLSAADATQSYNTNYGSHTEIWYLINPPTGSQTIDVIYASSAAYSSVGGLSLYNVDQSTGLQTGRTNHGTSGTDSVSITPTVTGSWCFAHTFFGVETSISFSDTQDWNVTTTGYSLGQHKVSPTINSANTLSFGVSGAEWAASGCEVLAHHS